MSAVPKWIKLSNIFEKLEIGQPIIHQNEIFVIAKDATIISGRVSLNKYDPINDKLIQLQEFDTEIQQLPDSFALDKSTNTVYFTQQDSLCSINLKTRIINKVPVTFTDASEYGWYHRTTVFVHDHKVHTFGLLARNIHTTYDIESGKFKSYNIPFSDGWFCAHKMIYIESQQRCLFMGGELYEIILSYDLISRKARILEQKLASKFAEWNPAVIKTKDENYAIIFYNCKNESNGRSIIYPKIFSLNLKDDSMQECVDIKMPHDGLDKQFAFLVDNYDHGTIIINGYVRNCWKDKEFANMNNFAMELINVVVQYYCQRDVHLLTLNGDHYKISLDDIFASL